MKMKNSIWFFPHLFLNCLRMTRNIQGVFAILLLISVGCANLIGQTEDHQLSLRASHYKINRLAGNQSSDQTVFSADVSNLLQIEIRAQIGNIQTSIVLPSGLIITPANAGANGGSFFLTNSTSRSPSIVPFLTGNFHYLYSIPTQETGSFTIRFQAPGGLTDEVPIFTEATWDSPVTAKLIATESEVVVGNPLVLTGIFFNGTQPMTGGNVQVSLRDQSENTTSITLLDNGGSVDDRSGDGLYSGEFTPLLPGTYSAVARFAGSVGSTAVTRISASAFSVLPAASRLTSSVTDQPRDDNSDGLIDRVTFIIGTNTTTPGRYQGFVHLRTNSGRVLIGNGFSELTNGAGAVQVDIPASAFLEVGENGPYIIELIELNKVDSAIGSKQVHRLRNLGQTQAYSLAQFQRKPLVLTGVVQELGLDENGNGKFDRLRVSVQVDVLQAGSYQWNMRLIDSTQEEIEVANSQGALQAGLNLITVHFSGKKIAARKKNGPFGIEDLLLFGPRSLVASSLGQTRPYLSEQFEGGSLDITPPEMDVVLTPNVLSQRQRMGLVTINAKITVKDDLSSNPRIQLLSVESNEPDSGTGPSDLPNDIRAIQIGSDDREFQLRAERNPTGNGRVYTVKYIAIDDSGNSTIVTRTVTVPLL